MMTRVRKPVPESGKSVVPQQSQFTSRPFIQKAGEHEAPVGEPRVSFSLADIDIFPRESVQPKLRLGPVGDRHEQEQVKPVPNRTGMPDRLKAGIESLSGIDMSDVRVHTNSDRPARLNALAYTQGNQIHLGPGQERHLPHEAWHVVQQKEGRVRATGQIRGMAVNDEAGLEMEAGRMGIWATQPRLSPELSTAPFSLAKQLPEKTPAQLIKRRSAMYPPSAASDIIIDELDNQVPIAETAAQNGLITPPTGIHTPHQAQYINNRIPANWGSCVEDELNPLAIAKGWRTQEQLPGSRPDYARDILPNIKLYVDLTTELQAGPYGNHITEKLNRSVKPNGVTWEGADITHNDLPGGPAPALHTNGLVTISHMAKFQAYKNYCSSANDEENDYDDNKQKFVKNYKNISHETFTQVWNRTQRDRFQEAATRAGF
jgi:hypothetical protein